MREGKIKLFDVEYPACLSTRVMMNVANKTGKPFIEGINELLSTNNIDGMFWVLSEMLVAGKKYHDLIGDNTPEPPTFEYLIDTVGFDDYTELSRAIYEAATDSAKADVDIEDADEKN